MESSDRSKPRSPGPWRLRIATLSLSLGSVSLAFLALLLQHPASTILDEWRKVALVMLALTFLLSLCLFFSRRTMASIGLLLGKLALAILTGLPFGEAMLFKLALWSSLFLDAGGYLDLPLSIILQAVFLAAILAFQRPLRAWGEVISGPGTIEILIACAYLAGLAVVLGLLRRSSDIIQEKAGQLARLADAVRHLTLANLSFQDIASTAQERAAGDERKRITREIHDAIGYALTNLIMVMEAALRLVPAQEEKLQELLGRARDEAQVGLNETRKALHMLRSMPQAGLTGLAAIHRLVSIFSKATGVDVKAEYCNADPSFGDERDMIIYRMVQEGMTNSFRHGHATRIALKFWQEEEGISVTLWDNGVGSGDVKEGIGLQGMRERIEQIGGMLDAGRALDGFELVAWLPLRPAVRVRARTATYEQDPASPRR